eukprot:scpid94071/ scgid8363/ 
MPVAISQLEAADPQVWRICQFYPAVWLLWLFGSHLNKVVQPSNMYISIGSTHTATAPATMCSSTWRSLDDMCGSTSAKKTSLIYYTRVFCQSQGVHIQPWEGFSE